MVAKFFQRFAGDRIFAFLNLTFLTDKRLIKPDYSSKPDRSVFPEVKAYIMRSRVSINDYFLPIQIRQAGKLLDRPSWVPDWTTQSHHPYIVPPPYATRNCAGRSHFWANYDPLGSDILNNPVQFRFSEDFEVLVIRGVVIDTVTHAFSVADGDELARQPNFRKKLTSVLRQEVLAAYKSFEAVATAMNLYGAKFSDAISRTIVANEWPRNTYPARANCDVELEQWKDAVEREDKAMLDSKLEGFESRITAACELRAFCLTEKGRIGLVPSIACKGDIICLFKDGRVPFVLRKMDAFHRWIGEAYIHGIMFGEGLENADHANVDIFHVQ